MEGLRLEKSDTVDPISANVAMVCGWVELVLGVAGFVFSEEMACQEQSRDRACGGDEQDDNGI